MESSAAPLGPSDGSYRDLCVSDAATSSERMDLAPDDQLDEGDDEYEYLECESDAGADDGEEMEGAVESKETEVPADCISVAPEQLAQDFDCVVAEAAELLAVSVDDAELLLARFYWDKRQLQDCWFDSPARARKRAGLTEGEHALAPACDVFCCIVCGEDVAPADGAHMRCGHDFCRACWREYLRGKVSWGSECMAARCMLQGCPEAVTRAVVLELAPAAVARRYRTLQLQSFVTDSRDARWCPRPGCEFAVRMPHGAVQFAKCACGHQFCIKCTFEAHRPAPCEWVRQWEDKCTAEDANLNWVRANTKACPACASPIEKNHGCNHMTCKCGHEFCWMCLQPWSQHGDGSTFYRCHKYEHAKATGGVLPMDATQQQARSELQRFVHYCTRFENHAKSREFGLRTLARMERTMATLHEMGLPQTDVQFLRQAAEAVIECRRVLKWTYVFAYYVPEGREKQLFLLLQECLEKNTESLHSLVETPLDQFLLDTTWKPFNVHASAVAQYTAATLRFLQNLLDGVDGGLTSVAGLA